MVRAAFATLAAAGTLVMTAGAGAAAAQETSYGYAVTKAASSVNFTIYAQMLVKMKREGTFQDFDGAVDYDPVNPSGTRVDLTVYTASIDTKHTDENQLLRSSDFFDVDRFPTMHFVSTAASLRPDGLLDVVGDLTIRGITRRLVVPIVVRSGDAFETTFQIDRTEFGLNGSPKLSGFNLSIGRKVQIHIAMHVAKPQGSTASGR